MLLFLLAPCRHLRYNAGIYFLLKKEIRYETG